MGKFMHTYMSYRAATARVEAIKRKRFDVCRISRLIICVTMWIARGRAILAEHLEVTSIGIYNASEIWYNALPRLLTYVNVR